MLGVHDALDYIEWKRKQNKNHLCKVANKSYIAIRVHVCLGVLV